MSLSPLKFSLGVSMLVHGLVIGGAVWLGQFHRTAVVVDVGDPTTLELIAASTGAPEQLVEAVVATEPPSLALPPPPPLPEAITPAEAVPSTPLAEAVLPAPTPTPQPEAVPKTVSTSTPVPPGLGVAVSGSPSGNVGDNSSPTLGKDLTTAAGNPTATAKPDYRRNPEPEYPLIARRRGQQGSVLLNITVSPTGRATKVSLQQSSGFELLDQAALKAVKTWNFEPARVGAMAVESKIEVPVRFKLTN